MAAVVAHRLLPAYTPLFPHAPQVDGESQERCVVISSMSGLAPPRPRLRNSTGAVSRDDCLTNAQLPVATVGVDWGPTRLQPTPKNCGVGLFVRSGTTDCLLRDSGSASTWQWLLRPGNGSINTDVNLNCRLALPRYQSCMRHCGPSGCTSRLH